MALISMTRYSLCYHWWVCGVEGRRPRIARRLQVWSADHRVPRRGDYLNWEARSWRLDEAGEYHSPGLRETGFWRFVHDPADPDESQAIELLLAHSTGYVELFYGHPHNQSSWELVTDALARSKSGMLVGGAKRLYGIVENGDLAYVEERVDPDGGLVPHLSARLARYVG